MGERTIVDFSRVEAALALATRERALAADRARSENITRLIKYSALGIAIVVVSIGIAVWLAKSPILVPPRPPLETGSINWPPPSTDNGPRNKIVTNLTLFNSLGPAGLSFFNPFFVGLTAGHRYNNSNAKSWEEAWCYADFQKDVVKVKIDLARRTRTSHLPQIVTQKELRELGLSETDVLYLRGQCPWRG